MSGRIVTFVCSQWRILRFIGRDGRSFKDVEEQFSSSSIGGRVGRASTDVS
jgi:hypothetical protein